MNYKIFKQKESGFTLIEISFVLLIIGLLIAGALGAKSYIDTQKANNEVVSMQQVVSATQAKFIKQNTATGFSTAKALNGNIFSRTSFVEDKVGNAVTNQFGGNVTLNSALVTSQNGDGFELITNMVPNELCQKITPLLSGFSHKVVVNGTTLMTSPDTTGMVNFNPVSIDSACSLGAAGLSIITVQFKLRA